MAKTATKKSPNTNKNSKNDNKSVGMSKITEEDENRTNADQDEEINSGFGNYLRSSEGAEMMKLFVIANTMVMFMTVAWPSIKESFYIIRDYFLEEQ